MLTREELLRAVERADDLVKLSQRYDESGLSYLVNTLTAIDRHPLLSGLFDVRLFNDVVMRVNLREEVGRFLFLHKAYELALSRFLVDHLRLGATVFDVGAHFGYFSLLAAGLVGADGTVHAFEATEDTAAHLCFNTQHFPQVSVHQIAVGDQEGTVTFNDFGPSHSAFNSIFGPRTFGNDLPQATQRETTMTTLDCFCERSGATPDLVKIDVESSEMLVLKGMCQILDQRRPVVVIEVGDFDHLVGNEVPASSAVLSHIVSLGYTLYNPTATGLVPHGKIALRYDYANVVCFPTEQCDHPRGRPSCD